MYTVLHVVLGGVVGHPYLTFFIGMLGLGDVVFVPAIYLSAHGTLVTWNILGLALLAGMLSDGFWYFLGYTLPAEKILSWGFVKKREYIRHKISDLVGTHAELMIVVSKFTYGTRTLMQLVAGARKIKLAVYLKANLLGHLLWFGSATIIAHVVQLGVGDLRDTLIGTSIAFAVFVCVVIAIQFVVSRFLKQKYHLQSESETE